ncbi:Fis family transcriptional regulator [Vibrio sp. YMD68]|uniref:Fis family transcriptional regulator n=1 Tax=Vibrio sp. YMD68 TaxID=3042300 RepID=UPI00249C8136|nr:Fis family transcriptional regulator [Vibrio sp. YMD68]WGV98098.1 Fis family transcriptional regulator [Vibrio sp. YMD68]
MRKTDKKIDNQIRKTLTQLCETNLKQLEGFQWLTHSANYSNFPETLKVTCVFSTNRQLSEFLANDSGSTVCSLVQAKLEKIGITLKNAVQHIAFDTDQNCENEHGGNWARRLG